MKTASVPITMAMVSTAAGLAFGACAPGAYTPVVQAPPSPTPTTTPAATTAPAPLAEDPALTAKRDEILARYYAALGGLDRVRAIQSIRTTGKARLGAGDWDAEALYASVTKRGGRSRSELTFQDMTAVDGYDGAEAWGTSPFDGRRDPFRKAADEAKRAAEGADMDGPLVDWRQKGHRVEYLGTEEIDGTLAHKLRVALKDGNFEYRYLDPDAMLPIRIESHTFTRGAEEVNETDLGDYEQVAGVWMPFASDSGQKGSPRTFHLTWDRIEVDVPLGDSIFSFPPAATKVARVIHTGPAGTPGASAAAPRMPSSAAAHDAGGHPISGLGARNIGSAAMSGRISAVAAGGRWTARRRCTSGPRPAACGSRPTAPRPSSPSSTSSPCSPSAPSPSTHRARRQCGSARARRGPATRFPSATASTSRPMAATPGRTWAFRRPSASSASSCTQRTATWSTRASLASCGATAPTAASTRQPTAGRPGRTCSRPRASPRGAPA